MHRGRRWQQGRNFKIKSGELLVPAPCPHQINLFKPFVLAHQYILHTVVGTNVSEACVLRAVWRRAEQSLALLLEICHSNTSQQGNCSIPEMDQSPMCAAVYCLIIMRLITKMYYNPPLPSCRAMCVYTQLAHTHKPVHTHQSEILQPMIKISM